MNETKTISVIETAKLIGMSAGFVRKLMGNGQESYLQAGRFKRPFLNSIEDYIKRNTVTETPVSERPDKRLKRDWTILGI